ncbi:MAG: DUF599 domain-containing protein [Pseudomonadota bacterium]
MEIATLLHILLVPDTAVAAVLVAAWVITGWLVERPPAKHPSVASLMADHRRNWMVNHLTRDPRVTDALLLGSLREGTAFFASACLIALGGGLALIGNTERLDRVAEELMLAPTPAILWEIKILLPLLFITNAFLKFVWANRVFGYCCVMMGAIPNDPNAPEATSRAETAAELNIEAAKAFNRGLRSVYFALGALGWLFGPIGLAVTTGLTILTVWQREFNSRSRRVLIRAQRGEPIVRK